jgi:hypothetical protein
LRESFFGTERERERERRIDLPGEKLRRSTARGGGGEFNLRESFHTKKRRRWRRRRRRRAQLEGKQIPFFRGPRFVEKNSVCVLGVVNGARIEVRESVVW